MTEFTPPVLAFEELWEPRTTATGVFGVVATHELQQTADGSDPEQAWSSNSISGKWGTLRTLDGSVPGLPNITGTQSQFWRVQMGRLFFDARPATAATGQSTGGYALISRQTFPRSGRITVETDIALVQGTQGAFAGIALIAGEGDYRELAIFRAGSGDRIDKVAPVHADTLAPRPGSLIETVTLRIEYDPVSGFRYLVNGQLVGSEAIDHKRAGFSADPNVGLYFTADASVQGAFASGTVGPVRVWAETDQQPIN